MTLEEATQAAIDINDVIPAGSTAKVTQVINNDYTYSYGVIVIDSTTAAAYDAADILTQALYGQSFLYAQTQAPLSSAEWLTAFNIKLTELLP